MATAFGAEVNRRREAAGLSLQQLAGTVHSDHAYLYRIEQGSRWPTASIAGLVDKALGAQGELFARWCAEDQDRQGAALDHRSVSASLRSSRALDELLVEPRLGEAVTAAEEAAASLDIAYLAEPPGPMLRAGMAAREAVVRDLVRHPSESQRRDLVRAAGHLSGILAYATLDLSRPEAAVQHAAAALRCAEAAGDKELCAWVRGTQSLIARYMNDFSAALDLARRGLDMAGAGTSRARLLAGVAQSEANLGHREEAHRALNQADHAIESAGTDTLRGLFTFSPAKLAYYSGLWSAGPTADRSLDDGSERSQDFSG